jgi:hypothetical protein
MRKIIGAAGLSAVILVALGCGFAQTPAATKSASNTMVLTFKDGHKQSFNLASIARIEFPAVPDEIGAGNAGQPLRGHFLGKWEVGDGYGKTFIITLEASGDAQRTLGNVHGKWVYVDGEAHITWDDGAEDAICKVGAKNLKFAFKAGKSFSDTPDNVTSARNLTPRPI